MARVSFKMCARGWTAWVWQWTTYSRRRRIPLAPDLTMTASKMPPVSPWTIAKVGDAAEAAYREGANIGERAIDAATEVVK